MIIPRVKALEIHVTYRCNLRCAHCHNLVSTAPSNEDMSIEWLLKLVHESAALTYPWEWLVLHGGEPRLHPKIETIYLILQAYKSRWNPAVNLKITTNGYGPDNKAAMELAASYGFEVCDSKKTGDKLVPYHHSVLSSPSDCGEEWNLGCYQSSECGICYTPRGYYECSPAGSAWRVMGYEPMCVDLKDLSAERLAEGFKQHCKHCGYARKRDRDGRDWEQNPAAPMTRTWLDALAQYSYRMVDET